MQLSCACFVFKTYNKKSQIDSHTGESNFDAIKYYQYETDYFNFTSAGHYQ